MNYKYNLILSFCLFMTVISTWGQLLPTKVEVDSVFNARCIEGQYLSASAYIVECASKRENIGDKTTALYYRLRNCELIEKHIDYFNEKGLTLDDYFFNWEIVSFLYRDLGNIDECISIYLNIINQMDTLAPDLLPSYSRMIATSLNEYTSEKYRDSIYSLSLAMDYITKSSYTKKDIEAFVWMAECFNWNRFYNSFKNNVRISDRIFECEPWFNKYKGFIDSLNKEEYKDDIVNYYMQHSDMLYILASTLGAQENRYEESIYLLNKGISYLDQIKELNDTIPIKIASFYSEIANEYQNIGDKALFKEYCDKAYEYLLYSKNYNWDYCTVLSQLALNYWILNSPKTAAVLKKSEIELRKGTAVPPSCSDYALFLKYNSEDTISTISIGKEIEKQYGNTNSSMASVYLEIANAFSKRMHFAIRNEENNSAATYKILYEEYLDKAKNIFELYKSYLSEYDLLQDLLGNLYEIESAHCARLNKLEESYYLSKKSLNTKTTKSYFDVSLKSAATHNKEGIHQFIPLYYNELESDIKKMLPILGSVESGVYLANGGHPLYRIPEWAQWNPTDSVCASIAYDASLLMKGLYLNYSSFAYAIGNDKELNNEFSKLNILKDSIYKIADDNSRMKALYEYEMRERTLRKKVDNGSSNYLFSKWTDILHCMSEKEVAIEFVCYDKNNYSWINDTICKHYIALIINKKQKYPLVVDLFDETELLSVYDMQPKSYETSEGRTLYKKLWGKISPYIIDSDKVYFSPMGMLNLINIESLTDENGVSASKRFSLRRLSSTRQILTIDNTNSISEVILFGAIDYDSSKKKMNFTLDSLNTRGNWSYLSGTKIEIENVAKACSIQKDTNILIFTGAQATEKSFKENISSKSIIHIASHGFYIPEDKRGSIPYYQNVTKTFNIDDDLFYSGLVFANGQEAWNKSSFKLEANDGILTAYEISKLNLHKCDLVILSACETGKGNRSFDGIIGLERGFKTAGARSVIMSLWKVDDVATSFMMEIFYKELLKCGSTFSAFRTAQEIVKEKYPDPYYWASFILLD